MLLLPESDLSLAIGAAANRFVIASSVLQTIIDYNRLFLRVTDGPSLAASSLSRRMHADARRSVVVGGTPLGGGNGVNVACSKSF